MKNILKSLLIFLVFVMEQVFAVKEHIISHREEVKSLGCLLEDLEKRAEGLTFPLEEEKELLKMLSSFELGQFLLKNKGLNGYWTSYIISNGFEKGSVNPLENWILSKAPVVKATRERFGIFQKVIATYAKRNSVFASIPCGLMDDLLGLDCFQKEPLQLVGIDLDDDSLKKAKENAEIHQNKKVVFLKKDAWALDLHEEFDLITSNGLNIYEPDDEKVVLLYGEFYKALRAGGILVTSFLTPPPVLSHQSTWKNIVPEDILKQKAIFKDIIQAQWQIFRTEEEVRNHLEKAGFEVLEVIYDSQGIFPTIVSRKPMKS